MKTFKVAFSTKGRQGTLIITANNVSTDADNILYADTVMVELPGPIRAIAEYDLPTASPELSSREKRLVRWA